MYKIIKTKQSTAKKDISATATDASLHRKFTIKGNTSSYNDENYECPDNFNQAKDAARYQSNPSATMQMNPAYSMEKFDGNNNTRVYENLKWRCCCSASS